MDSGLGRESRVYNLAGPGTLFQLMGIPGALSIRVNSVKGRSSEGEPFELKSAARGWLINEFFAAKRGSSQHRDQRRLSSLALLIDS